MFSDETTISRVGSYGRKYYYKRPQDKVIRPHHIKPTKQGGGGKMMIWGCITYNGLGDLSWLPKKYDSGIYITVLRDYVFNSRDYYKIYPAKFIFQQDNAKIHTSKSTKDYIKRSKIPIMEWLANSPDLNPIESIWGYLKKKLDENPEKPKNLKDL